MAPADISEKQITFEILVVVDLLLKRAELIATNTGVSVRGSVD